MHMAWNEIMPMISRPSANSKSDNHLSIIIELNPLTA